MSAPERWALREREERGGVTMDVIVADAEDRFGQNIVVARDVCVPERVYRDIGAASRARAELIIAAPDAFSCGAAAERERCAGIAER